MISMFKTTAAAALLALSCQSADAAIRYVAQGGTGDGTSWSQAMGDLQAAIDASAVGDQIWVAAGTYAPTSLIKSNKPNSKAFILKDGVSLYGGFAGTETSLTDRAVGAKPYDMTNATILSADDDQPDTWTRIIDPTTTYRWTWETASNVVTGTKNNSSHVLYCAATFAEPTVIDGFTLTGGNASIYQAKSAGGAVYGLGNLNLKNCRITENSAYFSAESSTDSNTYGGAVYLKGGSMDNCYVAKAFSHSSYGNGVGGGVYAENATISNCKFEDCVGLDQAGAVYLKGGTLDNCEFARCYSAAGGAILNNGGKITNITVNDCRALNGGAIYNAGEVVNALIAGCYADAEEYGDNGGKGGAIYNVRGDVVNCAMFNNTAFQGGGIYLKDGRVINSTVLNNSVRDENGGTNVYGQTADNTFNSITDPAVAMSNFVLPTSFAGHATNDAQAAAILSADWSLASGSEFIDKGTPLEGFTSGTDIAGNPRVAGASIDCGAYEYQAGSKVPTMVLTFAPGTQAAKLGIGGTAGYEFTIDWGDGVEVKYDQQQYVSHLITGSTVKIYGDEIVVLRAASQGIIAADLSRAASLIQVMLGSNGLTTLTLGNHPALTGLYAENNKLTSLDISGCPALTVLDVHENAIESAIDCSAMKALSKVDIADNRISSFKLPKHTVLYDVDCSNNLLTSLDVTGLSGIDELSCSGNKLTSIDLTSLTAATSIYLDGNELTGIDISSCTALEKIMVAENAITSIDLSKNPSLSGVYVQDNKLTAIDITSNPNVRWLNLGNNAVSKLDVTKQKYLTILIANNNQISEIDLSNNTSISSLDLSGNALTSVDVSKSAYLSQCHLENNALTSLDVTKNGYLYGLFCGNNKLTELNITKNTYLQRLEAQGNALTGLNLANNKGLQELLLQGNKLDKDSINAVITALPDVSSVNITPETESFIRQLNLSYMPGTADADVTVAENKGWIVTADYDSEETITPVNLNIQINHAGDVVSEVYNASIEWNNEEKTSLRINNMMGSSSNIIATIDADGNVKIAPQVCGGDVNGNFYMIVNSESKTGNPMAIYATYVAGKFDGKTLTLDPWNLIIVPYTFSENLGTVYATDLTTEFVKSNGTMTYTTASGTEVTQNIYGETKDKTVNVYGWAEYAKASLVFVDNKWQIDASQTACNVDNNDYAVVSPEGSNVTAVSVPDMRTVVFGAWQLKSTTGNKVLREATSATLKLGFDLPDVTAVEDVTTGEDVIGVIYYNAAGISSKTPFEGLNIKVETLSDGSQRITKTVHRF